MASVKIILRKDRVNTRNQHPLWLRITKDRKSSYVTLDLELSISLAKEKNAILLIAKLDRLSRNASFIMTLRDTGVNFVCCDMPEANTLTIGIMAVMAQDERERISRRTKDALAILKKRGVKLGRPQNLTQKSRDRAIAVNKLNA